MGNYSPLLGGVLITRQIYTYKCEGGHSFQNLILDRYTQTCPECGKEATAQGNYVNSPTYDPVPVFLADGTQVDEIQGDEPMMPPTPPEELVRQGFLSNDADRFSR